VRLLLAARDRLWRSGQTLPASLLDKPTSKMPASCAGLRPVLEGDYPGCVSDWRLCDLAPRRVTPTWRRGFIIPTTWPGCAYAAPPTLRTCRTSKDTAIVVFKMTYLDTGNKSYRRGFHVHGLKSKRFRSAQAGCTTCGLVGPSAHWHGGVCSHTDVRHFWLGEWGCTSVSKSHLSRPRVAEEGASSLVDQASDHDNKLYDGRLHRNRESSRGRRRSYLRT